MTFEPSVTKGKRKDKTLYLKEAEGQMCFFLRNQTSFLYQKDELWLLEVYESVTNWNFVVCC